MKAFTSIRKIFLNKLFNINFMLAKFHPHKYSSLLRGQLFLHPGIKYVWSSEGVSSARKRLPQWKFCIPAVFLARSELCKIFQVDKHII